MRNKTAFKKAQEQYNQHDYVRCLHYLKMVNLKEPTEQTYFWLTINKFFDHSEVFDHFQRVKHNGLNVAMHLVEYLGSSFWVGQTYDPNLYEFNSYTKRYTMLNHDKLEEIIKHYSQFK